MADQEKWDLSREEIERRQVSKKDISATIPPIRTDNSIPANWRECATSAAPPLTNTLDFGKAKKESPGLAGGRLYKNGADMCLLQSMFDLFIYTVFAPKAY